MCGIAGIATRGSKPTRDVVRGMCDVMLHRGPDGEGIHVAAGVGLGMRRLAIIDLTDGRPAGLERKRARSRSSSTARSTTIASCAPISSRKATPFRSVGDSEVIPHLYEEYGLDFISRLNGHVRHCAVGCAQAQAAAHARSRRHQAALLQPVSRQSVLRLRGQMHPRRRRLDARDRIPPASTSC